MKTIFIINPTAGKHNDLEDMISQMKASFPHQELQIIKTEYPGHATQIAAEIGKQGEAARIFAVGGDGTLNEVISGGYTYSNLSFGAVPTGTGNDFIRSMDACREDFFDFEKQKNGTELLADLGLVNGRPVVNSCSIGFDADVVSNYRMFKKFGSLAYNIAVFYTFFQKIGQSLKVSIDDNTAIEGNFLFTLMCNGKFYGGGFMPAPDADISDGLYDFVLIKKVSRLKIMQLIGKYKKGQHTHLDVCRIVRGKRAKIVSNREINVQFDGELIREKELNFELYHEKIKFIVPK